MQNLQTQITIFGLTGTVVERNKNDFIAKLFASQKRPFHILGPSAFPIVTGLLLFCWIVTFFLWTSFFINGFPTFDVFVEVLTAGSPGLICPMPPLTPKQKTYISIGAAVIAALNQVRVQYTLNSLQAQLDAQAWTNKTLFKGQADNARAIKIQNSGGSTAGVNKPNNNSTKCDLPELPTDTFTIDDCFLDNFSVTDVLLSYLDYLSPSAFLAVFFFVLFFIWSLCMRASFFIKTEQLLRKYFDVFGLLFVVAFSSLFFSTAGLVLFPWEALFLLVFIGRRITFHATGVPRMLFNPLALFDSAKDPRVIDLLQQIKNRHAELDSLKEQGAIDDATYNELSQNLHDWAQLLTSSFNPFCLADAPFTAMGISITMLIFAILGLLIAYAAIAHYTIRLHIQGWKLTFAQFVSAAIAAGLFLCVIYAILYTYVARGLEEAGGFDAVTVALIWLVFSVYMFAFVADRPVLTLIKQLWSNTYKG